MNTWLKDGERIHIPLEDLYRLYEWIRLDITFKLGNRIVEVDEKPAYIIDYFLAGGTGFQAVWTRDEELYYKITEQLFRYIHWLKTEAYPKSNPKGYA